MLARAAAIKQCGVNLIVLLALSDAAIPHTKRNTPRQPRALGVRCSLALQISFPR
jgi:hypothetical protein